MANYSTGQQHMIVHPITINASKDDLTEEDYRAIYDELREGISLDKFCGLIGTVYTKATWNNWENGKTRLTRPMKSELRRAVALPPLPATLHEVMDTVDPDTEVVRIGDQAVNRVILTGHVGTLNLALNGSVEVMDTYSQESPVISVTRGVGARRDRRFRPTVSLENRAWLEQENISADEAIDRLRLE
jgi:hypothetical protein